MLRKEQMMTLRKEYDYNLDEDEKKLDAAIQELNQRLENLQAEFEGEQDDDQDDSGTLWPSISERD